MLGTLPPGVREIVWGDYLEDMVTHFRGVRQVYAFLDRCFLRT